MIRRTLTFDGDSSGGIDCDDLVVGIPGETVSSNADAGAIAVFYGDSTNGITATDDQFWHQDSSGIEGATAANDLFGTRVLAVDDDDDGYADVITWVPGEPIPGGKDGRAHIIYGTSAGLDDAGDAIFNFDPPTGYETVPEEGYLCYWTCMAGCLLVGNTQPQCDAACEDICFTEQSPPGPTCEPEPMCCGPC